MPFTREQFFDVFRSYNESVWPAQLLLIAIAVAIVVASLLPRGGRPVRWLLASLWAWCGIAYFWTELAKITPAAWVFGAIFLAGSFLILHASNLGVTVTPARRAVEGLFIVYALVLYPLIGYLAGHRYPATPTFGAPCPLTIFTIGILIGTRKPLPMGAAIAPVLWSLIGGTAAFTLDVPQDVALPVAGMTLIAFVAADRVHAQQPLHGASRRTP